MKGKLVYRNGNIAADLFQCIGDTDLTTSPVGNYSEDVHSDGETVVAECTRDEFEECIGGVFSSVTSNNEAHAVLKRVQLLRALSPERFLALIHALQIREYADQEVIVQQNNPGDCFFIIKTGKVDVIKDGSNLRTITKHDYFGERSVLFNSFRSATIIANGPVSCWVLHQADFLSIIDENIRLNLQKRIDLQDDNITLADLSLVKLLGKGMFGNVFLAVHREKGHLYALKTVDRVKIDRYEIQENLVLERKILLQLDHTLILKLVRTFKDNKRVYFLTEFVRGMDLFDVLRQLNLVTDKDAKFYAGSLIVILEHLHERDIIYRDLKPENVMVDEDGYTKLIDFGTAKIVNGRTYTIVGTPHYMAPEVIVGKGYSVAVDYWSVGIMLYEFMCGGVPFGEEEEDPFAIYEKVLERRLIYPAFVDGRMPSKPVIEQLLSKNPAMRTGGSIENLKSNHWFTGLSWDQLLSRQIEPPYKPRVSDLSRDIQASLKSRKTLNDIISQEEANEEIAPSKSRKPKQTSSNWDEEF